VPLVARHQAPEVLQPREEAFDLPAAAIAAQLAAVLRPAAAAVGPVRRDQRDPPAREARIQGIAVVTPVGLTLPPTTGRDRIGGSHQAERPRGPDEGTAEIHG
jgi:hypothetical protein